MCAICVQLCGAQARGLEWRTRCSLASTRHMNERHAQSFVGVGTADEQAFRGVTGIVSAVEGRDSPGSPRGLPVAASMTIQLPSGPLVIGIPELIGDPCPARVRAIVDPAPTSLGCAICLSPLADSREHVPQAGLGGKVMLHTCSRCNNDLGSRVEPELQAFYDQALREVRGSVPGVRGTRRLPNVLVRQADDGTPVFLFDVGKFDPDVDRALQGETSPGASLILEWREPDQAAVRLAALKHAYLAGCLAVRGVPDTPRARAIRAELLAARDTPRGTPLAIGPVAAGIDVRLAGTQPSYDGVLIVDWNPSSGGTRTEVLLAGSIWVSWPFEPDLLVKVDEVQAARDASIASARVQPRGLPDAVGALQPPTGISCDGDLLKIAGEISDTQVVSPDWTWTPQPNEGKD